MPEYKIVEKDNPLAVHALCDTRERAEYYLKHTAPDYVAQGYYMDKTLTADSFIIQETR
jgi:hypothetical protein